MPVQPHWDCFPRIPFSVWFWVKCWPGKKCAWDLDGRHEGAAMVYFLKVTAVAQVLSRLTLAVTDLLAHLVEWGSTWAHNSSSFCQTSFLPFLTPRTALCAALWWKVQFYRRAHQPSVRLWAVRNRHSPPRSRFVPWHFPLHAHLPFLTAVLADFSPREDRFL